MNDEQNMNGEVPEPAKGSPGRPRHPKWDELNDIDRYLKQMDLAVQNLVTGKWKTIPRGVERILEMKREALLNKYPEYFKTLEARKIMETQFGGQEQALPKPNVPPVEKQPEDVPLWKLNVDKD